MDIMKLFANVNQRSRLRINLGEVVNLLNHAKPFRDTPHQSIAKPKPPESTSADPVMSTRLV